MTMLSRIVTDHVASGCWLIEQDFTRDCVFVHQTNVVRRKFLHINDRVRFHKVPNPRTPGEDMAIDVEIVGITVVRQVSDRAVQS